MKKKSPKPYCFLIMLILINVAGCQNNSNQIKKQDYDTTRAARKVKVEKSIPGSSCDTTIVSQEFSYEALAFDIFKPNTNKVKSLFLDAVTLKIEKHLNSEGGAYDLYNFNDGTNKIILFRGNSGFYIEDAEIKNDRMLLNKKISIGMKEDIFLELLKVKNIKCDTITVADEELTFESIYIFKDAKLRQIQMGSTVE